MDSFDVSSAGLTDQGAVRSNNEDAVWVDAESGLLIVADGMGGHSSGEVASGMAITTIHDNFLRLAKSESDGETINERLSPETNRLGFCVDRTGP